MLKTWQMQAGDCASALTWAQLPHLVVPDMATEQQRAHLRMCSQMIDYRSMLASHVLRM
jgi:hypothetical protein